MVDTVLSFEVERAPVPHPARGQEPLRADDEIGVFEMREAGLKEVETPPLFSERPRAGRAGTAVFAGMEGTRPLLVEIQALVAPSSLGTPRRAVVGWDPNRLAMLIAVLEARCGVRLGAHDVYLNVAGGLRLNEPAADLAAAAALLSSMSANPAPEDTVYFGEVSLTGAVRAVSHRDQRLKEAAKLGFASAVLPRPQAKGARDQGHAPPAAVAIGRACGSFLHVSGVNSGRPATIPPPQASVIAERGPIVLHRRNRDTVRPPKEPRAMPISWLDVILIAIMLISGFLAMVRGFTREVLSIFSWAMAAIAALYLTPKYASLLEPYVGNPSIAQIAFAAGVFIP